MVTKPPKRPGKAPDTAAILDQLHRVIDGRKNVTPRRSHSARLLARGTPKVAQKLGEETFECLIEAVGGDRRKLVGESADVLYHLVVLWVDQGIEPAEVWHELERREGLSGIEEKRSRGAASGTMAEGADRDGG